MQNAEGKIQQANDQELMAKNFGIIYFRLEINRHSEHLF